jgi:hypothetical protein
MTTLQQKFDELIEKQRALQKEFQTTAQALFKETTKEFFEQNPLVKAIVWTQYTPYFNDGDTCEFSVGCATFTSAPDPENIRWGAYDGEEEGIWTYGDDCYDDSVELPAEMNTALCDSFNGMIQSSEMEDVMKAMFDDHVQVVATRAGFEVSELDHD